MLLSANRRPPRIKSGAGFRRNTRYLPQFHIGPIGVCVQQGPKPPPFHRPR
jgi:hypothetical protein